MGPTCGLLQIEISQPEMRKFQGPKCDRKVVVLAGKPPGVGRFVCSG